VFSLRSDSGSLHAVDVSKIAVQYGGGGHKHAAGFVAPTGWRGDQTSEDPQQLVNELTAWARETFGDGPGRIQGCFSHMLDEIDELEAGPSDLEEWADLFILAFQGANLAGFDFNHLMRAVRDKHEINKRRRWDSPDERGVVWHIEQEG
jgi:hypothetical protein